MRALLLPSELGVFLLLAGCCSNSATSEQASPDANWKYVTFDRNCGATTGSNVQVSVLPSSARLPNAAANVFIADSNHRAVAFVAQPEWISARILQITYSSKARIFKKELRVGRIDIRYIEQADN